MRARPIPLILALGALAASVGFLASGRVRSSSPVAVHAGLWAYGWQVLLLVGGCATLYGWLRSRPEWEALGLVFAGFGGLAYVFAAVATRGLHAWTAAWLLGAASVSHLLRGWAIVRGRRWV